MEKLSFIAVIATVCSLTACGQKLKESQVPVAVKTAFATQYPNTSGKWEKEDGNYEVNFSSQGKTMSAVINKDGTILETETDIAVNELPASTTAYIRQHHSAATIKEASKVIKANGEAIYEARVNGKDLLFDGMGNFLREEKD